MSPFKVAVLIHTDDAEPARLMRQSYVSIFDSLCHGAELTFYQPPLDGIFPDVSAPNVFDLIVLGGGTYVPDSDAPCLRNLAEFEKGLIRICPQQKVVGICLGHQTMVTALGGEMHYDPSPELGVHLVTLNARGRDFFGRWLNDDSPPATFNMHEYHRRSVHRLLPQGLMALAENNQILLSDDGNRLSFQGHPEMTAELMRLLLLSPASWEAGYKLSGPAFTSETVAPLADREHDGLRIWKAILKWAAT